MQQMTQEGSVLQCQGELTKKISFKPSNVLSKAHRTLTLAVRKRAVKGSRIKKYAETIDPEQVFIMPRALMKNIWLYVYMYVVSASRCCTSVFWVLLLVFCPVLR